MERRIPLVPYSRHTAQLKRLKTGLALYRLVFGQPRQEDLLAFLGQAPPEFRAGLNELTLSLAPPAQLDAREAQFRRPPKRGVLIPFSTGLCFLPTKTTNQ